jgi:hypothetical protein
MSQGLERTARFAAGMEKFVKKMGISALSP